MDIDFPFTKLRHKDLRISLFGDQMSELAPYEHKFDFPYGENYRHLVIPHAKIEEAAPSEPGLYSWHFRLPRDRPERVLPFLDQLFHTGSVWAEVTGNMRQVWAGEIRTGASAFSDGISPLLAPIFFAVAYPLYIGISKDLRTRLSRHKEQLEMYKTEDPRENTERGEDDEVESRFFGQRLGAVFKKAGYFDTSQLFVKCVPFEQPPGATEARETWIARIMPDVRAAESACNTLFHPVFGRR